MPLLWSRVISRGSIKSMVVRLAARRARCSLRGGPSPAVEGHAALPSIKSGAIVFGLLKFVIDHSENICVQVLLFTSSKHMALLTAVHAATLKLREVSRAIGERDKRGSKGGITLLAMSQVAMTANTASQSRLESGQWAQSALK